MLDDHIAETSPKDTTKVNVSEHDSSVDKTIPEPPDEGDDDFVSVKNISGTLVFFYFLYIYIHGLSYKSSLIIC